MINEPIICMGNDLSGVLDDLRRDGKHPWALGAMVGGNNAQWGVSYFVTESKSAPKSVVVTSSEMRLSNTLDSIRHGNAPEKHVAVGSLPTGQRAGSLTHALPSTVRPAQGTLCSSAATVGGEAPIYEVNQTAAGDGNFSSESVREPREVIANPAVSLSI